MGKKNGRDEIDKKIIEAKLEEIRKYEKASIYIADKVNRQNEKLIGIESKIEETKRNLADLDSNDDMGAVRYAYYTSHLEELYGARAKAINGIEAYEASYYALSLLLERLRSNL